VDQSSINKCREGHLKSAGGYNWYGVCETNSGLPGQSGGNNVPRTTAAVAQVDIETGWTIAIHASLAAAERATGVCKNNICSCRNGKLKSAGGYRWRNTCGDEKPDDSPERTPVPVPSPWAIPVAQVDLESGRTIAVYASSAAAARATGVYQSHISSCRLGKQKTAGGFRWRDIRGDEKPGSTAASIAVAQVNLNGMVIAVHASSEAAANATLVNQIGINKCCIGKQGEAGGFRWRNACNKYHASGRFPQKNSPKATNTIPSGAEAAPATPGSVAVHLPLNVAELATGTIKDSVPRPGGAKGSPVVQVNLESGMAAADATTVDRSSIPNRLVPGNESPESNPEPKQPHAQAVPVVQSSSEGIDGHQWSDVRGNEPPKSIHVGLGSGKAIASRGNETSRAGPKQAVIASPVKPVVQIELKTGVTIAVHASRAEAARATGISVFLIGACCLGKQHSAGGYGWRNATFEIQNRQEKHVDVAQASSKTSEIPTAVQQSERSFPVEYSSSAPSHSKVDRKSPPPKSSLRVPVAQIDPDTGNVVCIHASIKGGAFAVGGARGQIAKCLKGQARLASGFEWRRASPKEVENMFTGKKSVASAAEINANTGETTSAPNVRPPFLSLSAFLSPSAEVQAGARVKWADENDQQLTDVNTQSPGPVPTTKGISQSCTKHTKGRWEGEL
jgi:hypothetical protein